jgi:hypothetical protein
MENEKLQQRIQELENKMQTLEKVDVLRGKTILPDKWDINLKRNVNDNFLAWGTVYFTDDNPIIMKINNATPQNIVLTNYPTISYIRRSDDGLSNELFIGAGDVGGACNYVILKNTDLGINF